MKIICKYGDLRCQQKLFNSAEKKIYGNKEGLILEPKIVEVKVNGR